MHARRGAYTDAAVQFHTITKLLRHTGKEACPPPLPLPMPPIDTHPRPCPLKPTTKVSLPSSAIDTTTFMNIKDVTNQNPDLRTETGCGSLWYKKCMVSIEQDCNDNAFFKGKKSCPGWCCHVKPGVSHWSKRGLSSPYYCMYVGVKERFELSSPYFR